MKGKNMNVGTGTARVPRTSMLEHKVGRYTNTYDKRCRENESASFPAIREASIIFLGEKATFGRRRLRDIYYIRAPLRKA